MLSRADTRNLTRQWMLAHIPAGAKIVAEPVEPEEWAREVEPGTSTAHNPYRWRLYPALSPRITPGGSIAPAYLHEVGLENYETTLYPALIDFYEREGYCWVITGSTESGRAFADPHAVPHAIAYYRALARARRGRLSRLAVRARAGSGRVQLRLELRLLPARLRPARPADDDLPPARRALPRRMTARAARGSLARGVILG